MSGSLLYLSSDPIDDHIASDVLRWLRPLYFPPTLQLPAGSLIVDIGAHSGHWTVEALAFWPGTHVIAIEPNPEKIENLRRHVSRNGLVDRCTIVAGAIGKTCSRKAARLSFAPEGSWGDTIFDIGISRGVDVDLVTLESVLCGRVPTLIKCNAEGAEFIVIPQMMALGVHPRYLLLAVHSRFGDANQIQSLLRENGYRVTDISGFSGARWVHCEYVRLDGRTSD